MPFRGGMSIFAMEKLLQFVGILLLSSMVGQSQGQFLPVLEWIQSFFGGYEEPPYFVNRTLGPVSFSLNDEEDRTYAWNDVVFSVSVLCACIMIMTHCCRLWELLCFVVSLIV